MPEGTSGTQIEVCPQGGAVVERMSAAIAEHGGCALIVDYGEDGSYRHTLRVSWTAIRLRAVSYFYFSYLSKHGALVPRLLSPCHSPLIDHPHSNN